MDDGVGVRGGGRVIGPKYYFEMQDMMFTREAHVLTDGLEGYGVTIETPYDGSLSLHGKPASGTPRRARGTHTHTHRRDY